MVCRAFKKRNTGQAKINNEEGWESNYFYEESSGVSSIVDPLEYIPRQPPTGNFMSQNLLCKQEIEANNNSSFNFLHSDQFVQLPQLESPSLPLMKRPSSMSLVSENNRDEDDQQITKRSKINKNVNDRVTDWRALDKFVAYQLSHDDDGVSSYEPHNGSDLGMLLLQNGREEGPKLDDFLSSTSNRDIGICIFDK